jgi:hypothetical protein
MRTVFAGVVIVLLGTNLRVVAQSAAAESYLGFDRNEYPGEQNLQTLRRTFSFAGYWLNNPPGAKANTWMGKRPALQAAGFGFLVLFNGRLYKELKRNPLPMARSDARTASSAAKREGFAKGTVIFLDIEEGGRMLPEQKSYIYAWVDAIITAGFRAGVYCSGIPAAEGKTSIVTAEDIRANAQGREITYWVTNDVCPPSPGCVFPKRLPSPGESRVAFAEVWQFAQSPRRRDFAAMCHNYHPDGNCYPPAGDVASKLHLDIDSATSSDPSEGRQ